MEILNQKEFNKGDIAIINFKVLKEKVGKEISEMDYVDIVSFNNKTNRHLVTNIIKCGKSEFIELDNDLRFQSEELINSIN